MITLKRLLSTGAAGLVLVACADAAANNLTGTPEVPIPRFAYSFVGCLSWSCASGQCQNDPAVWGACCLDVSPDPEEPGYERPSCSGPSYCDQYPARCGGDLGPAPGLAASYCFHANVGRYDDQTDTSICSDPTWSGGQDVRCNGQFGIDDFPECFPTSGIN